jgi:hypothetical protein
MATVATRLEKNNVSPSQNKIDLTPTGLLMEGDSGKFALLFRFFRDFECYGDLSPTGSG